MPILDNRIKYKQLKIIFLRILQAIFRYQLLGILIAIALCIIYYQKRQVVDNLALDFIGKILINGRNLSQLPKKYFQGSAQINEPDARDHIAQISLLRTRLTILEAENIKLKQALNFNEHLGRLHVSTTMLSVINNPYEQLAIIGAGINDSIRSNQVVIADGVLVGRIMDVSDNFAKVALVTDFRMRVAVVANKARQRCIVSGNNSHLLELKCEKGLETVEYGDILVTSGDSQYYPPGLPVAQIISSNGSSFVAEPLAQMSKMRIVSVLEY